MIRILKITLSSLAVLLLVVSAVAWWLLSNEAFLKRQAADLVYELTGRNLRIDGSLTLAIGSTSTVVANDVYLSNADWADRNDMLRIGSLNFQLDSLSLFSDQVYLHNIEVNNLDMNLEDDAEGNNWNLFQASEADRAVGRLPVRFERLELNGIAVSYSASNRELPLEFRIDSGLLEQREDDQLILNVEGSVDSLPLQITGDAGPFNALIYGGEFSHQLELTMGEISFHSAASLEDGSSVSGLYLGVDLQGPDFTPITDLFGLPEVSDDPFEMRLILDARQGAAMLDLTGSMGQAEVSAEGDMDDLLNPTEAHGILQVIGLDISNLAEIFGIGSLPESPYRLDLDANLEEGRIVVNLATVDLGTDLLVLEGELGSAPEFLNSRLNFSVAGEDLSRWDSLLNLPLLELAPFTLEGSVGNDSQGALSSTIRLNYAGNELAIEGPLGLPPQLKDVELAFNLRSSDVGELLGMLGAEGLPASPVEAQGQALWSDEGVDLSRVDLSLQDNSAQFDAFISLGDEFSGSSIEGQLDSPSAASLGELLGQAGLPDQQLRISGSARPADAGIEFEIEEGRIGDIQLTLRGQVPDLESAQGIEVDFTVAMPSLRAAAIVVEDVELPDLPFDATGHVAREAGLTRFADVEARLGNSNFRIDGGWSDQESYSGSYASIAASGPNLAEILNLPALQSLPQDFSADAQWRRTDSADVFDDLQMSMGSLSARIDGSVDDLFAPAQLALNVHVEGSDASVLNEPMGLSLGAEAFELVTDYEGSFESFDLTNLQVAVGANAVAGDLAIVLTEPAGISGRLNSEFLDVSPWISWNFAEADGGIENGPPLRSDLVFTDEPLPEIEVSAIPVELDVSVDAVVMDEVTFNNVRFGLQSNDQLLRLSPLQIGGIDGNSIVGSLQLDVSGEILEVEAEIQASNFRFGFIAIEGQALDTVPSADLFFDITGSGSTYRQMASSLDGHFRLQLGEGQISNIDRNIIVSDVLRELIRVLNPFARSRPYTNLECAIVAAEIVSGRATVDPMIVQTQNVTILSSGSIDLNTEDIDLTFNSRERTGIGINPGIVVNPFIKLGGRMSDPSLALDPLGGLVIGGVAVATGGVSLLARSLGDRYLRDPDPCGTAVEDLMARDGAGN